MIKYSLLIVFFFIGLCKGVSQESLNDYKYVIVPNSFEFLNEPDKYQLNSLTKFLFEKYGFTAIMAEDVMPDDFIRNSCLALKSNVIRDRSLFNSKLQVELKNCRGQVVFTSKVGESKDKSFKTAYHIALREAFTSFETVNYTYVPNNKFLAVAQEPAVATSETKEEIEKLKAEIEQLKQAKESQVEIKETPSLPETKVVSEVKEEVATAVETSKATVTSSKLLYAQPIENGFQLVDSTPKVVYKIKKTSSPSMFIVEYPNGTLTKSGETWMLEYYQDGELKTEKLEIKF